MTAGAARAILVQSDACFPNRVTGFDNNNVVLRGVRPDEPFGKLWTLQTWNVDGTKRNRLHKPFKKGPVISSFATPAFRRVLVGGTL